MKMRKILLVFLGFSLLTSVLITGAFAQLDDVTDYVNTISELVGKGNEAVADKRIDDARLYLEDAREAYAKAEFAGNAIPAGDATKLHADLLLAVAKNMIDELAASIEWARAPISPQVTFPSGDGYKIKMPYALGAFGGSATDIEGTSPPYLKDIKGQPVIGEGSETILGGINGYWGAGYQLWVAIVREEGVPYGTVPLTISRAGDDVQISWDSMYVNPRIFVLTGEGSGEYTNDLTGWVEHTDGTIALEFDTSGYPNGILLHKAQIGGGHPEVYYKGLQAGITDHTAINPETNTPFLTSAWAVGKYDYVLPQGYNLISIPLSPMGGNSISAAFNGQLDVEDVEVFARDDVSGRYSKSQFINGVWEVMAGSAITFSPGKAYWVRVYAEDTVSLLGAVGVSEFLRDLYGSANASQGYNLFGWPFPNNTPLELGGMPPRGEDEVFMRLLESGAYLKAITDGAAPPSWINPDPAKPLIRHKPGVGYWYRNRTDDFPWTAPLP